MKKILLTLQVLILFTFYSFAQIPSGYYDDAGSLTGAELKTALSGIIDNHTSLDYGDLWTAFEYTDKKPSGEVWDMYSNCSFTFGDDQDTGSGGTVECDKYNREHSFPKSWFFDGYPMYTDIFHLYPTDKKVNSVRSNYPYGEVSSPSYTSNNGSKLGSCSYPGYSGIVFEPIDEYKGDFARGYFYMATRYESNISSWSSEMLDGTSYPAFAEWAVNLLMDWHQQDPVSQKEIDRNNVIYDDYQHNRNPFIDHPEYVDLIWGDGTPSVAFTSSPSTVVEADSEYTYNVTASGGNGSSITISSTQKPAWLTFTGGTNGTATLSGTPSESDEGDHSVVLNATDGESTDEQAFTITVEVAPLNLVFTSTPVTSVLSNQQYSYSIEAVVEGDESAEISFEGDVIPGWLTFTDQGNGSAILYGTPADANVGNHDVQVIATSVDLETSQSFVIQVTSGGSGGDFIETFTLMPAASSSYTARSWTGDNDIDWSATNARTDQTIDGPAICLKDLNESYLLSQSISGGVSWVSFDHEQKFTGTGGEITLFVNDVQVGDPVVVTSTLGEASFSDINVTGEFTIKLVSNGLSRIAIDNLAWTSFSTSNQSPVFGEISHSPTSPAFDEIITFSAVVTDPDGTVDLVKLLFGNSSSSLDQNQTMSNTGDDTFSLSSVMPLDLGDVYYKIEATDNEGNISISPQFVIYAPEIQYTLQIEIVGDGQVTVNGSAYLDPLTVDQGTVLNLVATANDGSQFDGWSGDLTSTQSSESISMTSNISVTANFNPVTYPPVFGEIFHSPLHPTVDQVVSFSALVTDPDGTVDLVTLHFGNTSNELDQSLAMSLYSQDVYTVSSVVPLDIGDVYYAIEATDNEGNSAMSSEFQITAAPNQYTLSIDVVGQGVVNVDGNLYSAPLTVDDGTVLSLLAIPNEGSQFDGWTTDLNSTLSEESVTMTDDKSITATFSLINSVKHNVFKNLQIYPNPFSSSITLINADEVSKVSFVNLMGQTVKSKVNPKGNVETLDLPVGLYLLKVEDVNGNFLFKKIIKK
jgi:uncharacterized repeat protein (TIGR02543 family)